MTELAKTLLLWLLPWTAISLAGVRFLPKAAPAVHALIMLAAVGLTTVLFGAPHPGSLLSLVLFWPLLGAVVILFLPRQWANGIRQLSVIWAWVGFIASIWLLGPVFKTALTGGGFFEATLWSALERFVGAFATAGDFGHSGYQFVEDVPWIATFGIHYKVGVDGISLWMVLLTTLLTPIALAVSWNSVETKVKEYAFAFLLLEVGMLGAFVALDLFLFYVFWELMLVPMYLIIGIWGGKERVYAAVKFFLFTMVGSLLMLVAILYVVAQYRSVALASGVPPELAITFDIERLHFLALPQTQQVLLFLAFGLAFAIKVPMFPFHTWLPDAHVQAPTGGSVILAAVLLKLGCYGFLRFAMPLFPFATITWAPNLAGIAVVGIVYGAYCAWVQRDVKKLVAYSSVSHLGFVMLGIFSLNAGAMEGAVLQMISHGVSTGALFILVGVIYDRRHTRDLADFGGLAKVMPVYATVFIIVAMSSIGLPGTNGFVGEFMVLSGTFVSQNLAQYGQIQALIAATGVILAAIYMLHAVLKMFWGPVDKKENDGLADLSRRERWSLAPLIVLIFWIGLVPNFFLHPMRAAVAHLTQGMQIINAAPPSEPQIMQGGLPQPAAPAAAPEEGAQAAANAPAADQLALNGGRQ